MLGRLLVDRIDQIERVPGVAALIGLGLDPDREELRAEISALRLVEADVAEVVGIGRSDVEAFIEKTLRCIGVGVDDQRGVVDGARLGSDGNVGGWRGRRLCGC